ncbi:hypothetical protein D3C78_1394590 [compost metagenome]
MGRELGRLGDHRAVDVADLQPRGAHAPRGFHQQLHGIRALELRVGVGKVPADVPQRRAAQQRIGDGMQQHVGIRMPEQAHAVGNFHAADDELAAGHQGVDIPTFTDPKLNRHC